MTVKDNEERIEELEKKEKQRRCQHTTVQALLNKDGTVYKVCCSACDAQLYDLTKWKSGFISPVPSCIKEARAVKKIFRTYVGG